jgi:hypothetical protein
MDEFTLVFELINGNRKSFNIDHDTFLEFNNCIRNNKTWFTYGGNSINLNNVCYYNYSLIENNKPKTQKTPSNAAEEYIQW